MTVSATPESGPDTSPIPTASPPAPPSPEGTRRSTRRARKARARSAGGARWGLTLLGLLLLAAGVLTVLLVTGLFGAGRAMRPVIDPMIVDALSAQPDITRGVAVAAGVVLLVLGLVWTVRAVRPESRPDVVLDDGAGTTIRVDASAAADAVADGAAALPGVTRARARTVGSAAKPAVRAVVWIDEDAPDHTVTELCRRLDDEVLAQVRDSLSRPDLPVAVRLELDSKAAKKAPRVE
ncbi:alkaline shock response membrane anchor protein AmaP [Pseudonocardia phyllosphaerae]|uniref:alkaline shock response membrane anchor protein AmaP n=1 Tax=Pseudonocardia phyllosphaerae TaxID=3390502 RepID=UPI003979B10E